MSMTKLKPFAFVLMPFSKEFDDVYKLGIKAVADELGVVAERVDEQIYTETMLERIYRQIEAADFIIADMTGRNPNVFYEVGYAHAKGKLCTLLTRSADDIPFDLKHRRHLVYGNSIQNLRSMLSSEIAWLKDETEKTKAATLSIFVKSAVGSLATGNYRDTGKLDLVIDIHNRTDKKTPEVEAIYLYTGKGWTYSQSNEECPSTEAGIEDYSRRHFLKSPVTRLSAGTWAQLRLSGERVFWSKFKGDERKDSYQITGRILLEIVTAEGNFRETLSLDVEFSEIPF
jgi:nucleoside 2-deoxyribosyltransferase